MNENFSATIDTKVDKVDTHFRSLRNPAILLSIKVSNSSQSVQIKTNDMDLAGSIVQDLSAYLGVCVWLALLVLKIVCLNFLYVECYRFRIWPPLQISPKSSTHSDKC
jgi:hypothetical protein